MNILYGNNNKVKVSANRWTHIELELNRSTILLDFSKKNRSIYLTESDNDNKYNRLKLRKNKITKIIIN